MTHKLKKDYWFKMFSEKNLVKYLVKGILNCGCPVEIFDHYMVRHRDDGSVSRTQLVVGNRLLLEIAGLEQDLISEELINKLLKKGLQQREEMGLNRFRLVIVTHGLPDGFSMEKVSMLSEPNIHLHILDPSEIKNTFDS